MTDKEVKSFDTVDLLAPMDLIPIKGSESPAIKVETESKQEANTKTDKYAPPNLEGRSTKSGVKNMKGYLQRRSLKPLKENCYKYAIAFSIMTIVAYIVEIVVGKTETNHFTSVFFMSIASIIWIIFFTAIGIKTIDF